MFPKKCVGCNKEGFWFCQNCQQKIQTLLSSEVVSYHPLPQRIIAACNYQDPLIKKLLYTYKYQFVQEIGKILSDFILQNIPDTIAQNRNKNFVVLPIPLHKKRLRWRGFNQAAIIAQNLANKLDLKTKNDILNRCRNTLPQVKLKGKKRKQNIRKAFVARKDPSLNNKIILLVDDVCTTGSTLKEASRAILKANKPREIWGVVFARG